MKQFGAYQLGAIMERKVSLRRITRCCTAPTFPGFFIKYVVIKTAVSKVYVIIDVNTSNKHKYVMVSDVITQSVNYHRKGHLQVLVGCLHLSYGRN